MIIHSRYAITAPGQLLRDVRLETTGDRISAISTGPALQGVPPDYVFNCAVLTPGLVNAHAHLELEFCRGAVPFNGSFIDWLQAIRVLKKQRGGQSTAFPRESMDALLAAGCTTVVDHHTCELDWSAIEAHGLRHVPLREVFGFSNHDPDPAELERIRRLSFAPHAPYTASIELVQACHELARNTGQPISVHLQEIAGEISFIRDGQGAEFAGLLRLAGAFDEEFTGTGRSPIQLYAEAGLLPATYAVHANYLAPGDLEFLAAFHPTVVYCPRSHAFFNHPPHPLPDYLAAGVPVAFGTDSLASNDRLAPLHEAALARERFPAVDPAELFAAITTRGLEPLGWDLLLGELQPGRIADLAVFNLDSDPGADFGAVFDALLESGGAELTMVGGKIRYRTPLAESQATW